uniref:Uncharacterized protein n=1 Tax=Brassica oleracea TaxID=3712 RepID=A0A3P6DSB3_BRAOL|nr:unnamed protein product [Brassica oleracea]
MIEVTLNQEDHSYMFDDDDDESTTPVKACSESGNHHVTADQTIKKLDVPREAHSSVKRRRRMLQFEDQPMETSLFRSESLSSILRSSLKKFHEILILSLMLLLFQSFFFFLTLVYPICFHLTDYYCYFSLSEALVPLMMSM